jgi:hypothetical protein
MKVHSAVVLGALVVSSSSVALADEGSPAPAPETAPISVDASPARAGTESPSSSSAAPRTPERGAETDTDTATETDHDARVGRLSLAFHGTRTIAAASLEASTVSIDGTGSASLSLAPEESTVPLFGIRYWATKSFGVDVGLGFGFETGSYTKVIPNPDPTLDRTEDGASARRTNLAARVATPLSLHSGKHYHLMVIPEVALGYSRALLPGFRASTTGAPLDLRLSGLVFGVGALVGSELSFGFLGAPQLSLQTAWGLRLESRTRSGKIGDAETSMSEFGIGSSFHGEPWQWLTGSLSLFYSL